MPMRPDYVLGELQGPVGAGGDVPGSAVRAGQGELDGIGGSATRLEKKGAEVKAKARPPERP